MVRANPDVLAALGSEPVLQACMQASRTLPIVFVANNYDPIARGYVRSLAAPGGNSTGVFLRQTELAEKQVELLRQAFPDRTRLAVLWDAISAHQFAAASQRASLLRSGNTVIQNGAPSLRYQQSISQYIGWRGEQRFGSVQSIHCPAARSDRRACDQSATTHDVHIQGLRGSWRAVVLRR